MEQPFSALMEHYNVQYPQSIRTQYWKRYDDSVGSMSTEQRLWVSQQDAVLNAKLSLRDCFIDYMFGLYRDAFVAADDKNRKISDDYINTLQQVGSSYISHAEKLEQENKELKEKLEKLLEEKNDRVATDGSRRDGKTNSEKTVRKDGNSRQSSENYELFPDQPQ